MASNPPVVRLYRNPWAATLADGVVLQMLVDAATNAQQRLALMIAGGDVEEGRDSFAAVLLDPTRPTGARTLTQRIFAVIGIGPNWERYVPNGAAKADAHDRHDVLNGELVAEASHCLGNDDFAWGDSAEYLYAIGGGSGLSAEQDGDMVLGILIEVMDRVRHERDQWLAEQRRDGNHRWFNPEDLPGAEYAAVLEMVPLLTAEHV